MARRVAICALVVTGVAIVAYCVLMYLYVTGKPAGDTPTGEAWDRAIEQLPLDQRAGPLLERAYAHVQRVAESRNSKFGWRRMSATTWSADVVPDAPEVGELLADPDIARAIELFQQASGRAHFGAGIVEPTYLTMLVPLVRTDALHRISLGDHDGALNDAIALVRIAHLCGRGPTSSRQGEGARHAAEAWSTVSAILVHDVDDRHLDVIEAMCQEFADEPRLDENADEIDLEWWLRSVYSPSGRRTLAGDELVYGSGFTHSDGPQPLPWLDLLAGPWGYVRAVGPDAELARAREVAARYHKSRVRPPSEWSRRVDRVPDEWTRYPALAGWVPGAYRFIWTARAHQQRDGVRAAVAILRFQRREGRWPTSLEELVPRDLSELPRDIVDNQPLRYRVYSDGPVLYSIGFDRVDNGGEPERRDDGVPEANPEWWYHDESRERRQPQPGDAVLWPKPK